MKKVIFIFLLTLFCFSHCFSNWEFVAFKNSIISAIGFDKELVYVQTFNPDETRGIYLSTDGGITFERRQGLNLVYEFMTFENKMFAANEFSLASTKDSGKSWLTHFVYSSMSTPTIYSLDKNENIIFAGAACVYKSTNKGESWSDCLIPELRFGYHDIFYWNDTLFASYSKGFIYSLDNGNTWDTCFTSISNTDKSYYICSTINNSNYYIGTSKEGLYRSSNRGRSWIKCGEDIICDSVYALINDDSAIIVGTARGIFYSPDNGTKWFSKNIDLPFTKCFNLYNYYNEIWAATDNGIYKTKIIDILSSSDITLYSTYISIFPNPATDYIEITVPRWRGQGEDLRIYDVLGIEQPTSPQSLSMLGEGARIDVSVLAPGVYFVRVGDRSEKFIKI